MYNSIVTVQTHEFVKDHAHTINMILQTELRMSLMHIIAHHTSNKQQAT